MSFSVAGAAGALQPESEAAWKPIRVGSFLVEPDLNRLSGPAGAILLEPKTMAVLMYLAANPGRVVSNDELIQSIWLGRPMGDNPVYRCISQLRRAFVDDAREPAYIATIPTRGYRLLAPIQPLDEDETDASRSEAPGAVAHTASPKSETNWKPGGRFAVAILMAAVVMIGAGFWLVMLDRTPAAPVSGPPTLAVLPLNTAATDPEGEMVADAMAAAILSRLAEYRDLRVIARSSSFALRGSSFDVPRVARLLGVQYLLQGELHRRGDHVQVHFELVDQEGFQIWSNSFEHIEGQDFEIQKEIARAVAERVVGRALSEPSEKREPDFAAFQHWVIGHELMVRRPEGFVDAARAHFTRAIEIDPGFAAPYAERAMQLVLISGATDDDAEYAAARQDIDRALALDPNEAVAHAALGLYEWYRPHRDDPLADDVAAEASFRRALELDPYLVSVWNWLARALQAQGRHDEADEAFSNAARIDPLAATIGSNLARSEASRGLFEEAEARLLRLSEAPQPSEVVVFTLIDLYIDSGRFQPALETLRHWTLQSATNRSQLIGMSYLGRLSADLGDTQGAEAWQARALAEAEDPDELRLHWIGENIGTPIYEYAKSAGEFRQALKALGRELGEVEPYMQLQYGALLSLAGEFTEAGEILAPLLMPGGLFEFDELVHDVNVRHSLYWAWLHSGDPDRAVTELRMLEAYFQQKLDNGRMHRSDDLIDYARNQLLLGDTERALDLLERAERAGWRGYFHLLHDPRWNAIRDSSRFRAVMARTREDIDSQRAGIEEAMPEAEFVAKLDAAMRLRKELN